MISVCYKRIRFLSILLISLLCLLIFSTFSYARKGLPDRIPNSYNIERIKGTYVKKDVFHFPNFKGRYTSDTQVLHDSEKLKILEFFPRDKTNYSGIYIRIVGIFGESKSVKRMGRDRVRHPEHLAKAVKKFINYYNTDHVGIYDRNYKGTGVEIGVYNFVPASKKESKSVVSKVESEPPKKKVYVKPRSRSDIYRKDLKKISSKFIPESRGGRKNYDQMIDYVTRTLKDIPANQKIFVEVCGFADKVGFNGAESNKRAALRRAGKAQKELLNKGLLDSVTVKEFAYNAKDIIHNDRGVEVIFYRGTDNHESIRIVKAEKPEDNPIVTPREKRKQVTKNASSSNIFSNKIKLIENVKKRLKDKKVIFLLVVFGGVGFIAVVSKSKRKPFRISSRVIIVGALVCVALGLFYFQHEKNQKKALAPPKAEPTEWEYKIKGKDNFKKFKIEASTPYSFQHSNGFSQIIMKEQSGNSRQATLRGYGRREFCVLFDRPMELAVVCRSKEGIFTDRTSKLYVYKNRRNGSRLFFLSTNKWIDLGVKTRKGYRINWPKFDEPFIFGKFKNGEFTGQSVFSGGSQYHSWFWDSYDLKCKAGEVPFIALGLNRIYTVPENLIIEAGRYKYTKEPCYLSRGQIFKTGIYLDKEDDFGVDGLHGYKGYVRWMNWKGMKKDFTFYRNKDNELEIRADKTCIIGKISVNRRTLWFLKLRPGQEKKIKVFKGDVISHKSRARYYLNDKLIDAINASGERWFYTVREDGYLVFKGSVAPEQIDVFVEKRKGY